MRNQGGSRTPAHVGKLGTGRCHHRETKKDTPDKGREKVVSYGVRKKDKVSQNQCWLLAMGIFERKIGK